MTSNARVVKKEKRESKLGHAFEEVLGYLVVFVIILHGVVFLFNLVASLAAFGKIEWMYIGIVTGMSLVFSTPAYILGKHNNYKPLIDEPVEAYLFAGFGSGVAFSLALVILARTDKIDPVIAAIVLGIACLVIALSQAAGKYWETKRSLKE